MSDVHYPDGNTQHTGTSNVVYTVTSSFPPSRTRPRSFHRYDKQPQRDSKDIPQAALINIVAAVNVDLHRQHLLKRNNTPVNGSVSKAISDICNKNVSIPKQRMFTMPQESVQRKPVYYKNSPDLEVRRDCRIRLSDTFNGIRLAVKSPSKQINLNRSIGTPRASVPTATKPRLKDLGTASSKAKSDRSETISQSSISEKDCRAVSGIRKLGCVKCKHMAKTVKEIPKCDAVDLMETQDEDLAKAALEDSRKLIPNIVHVSIPYVRTKSLPSIFPTKSSRQRPETVPPNSERMAKERHPSQKLRKRSAVSACRGKLNIPVIQDSPLCIQRLYRTTNETTSDKHKPLTEDRAHLRHSDDYLENTNNDCTKRLSDHRILSGKSSLSTDASVKTTASSLSIRSCLTWRLEDTDTLMSERNTPKRVQFAGNSSVKTMPISEKVDHTNSINATNGHSPIDKFTETLPTLQTRVDENKPMSAQELLIVQQKVLPANITKEDPGKTFRRTDTALTIQGLTRSFTEVTHQTINPDNNKSSHKEKTSDQIIDKTMKRGIKADVNDSCVDSSFDTYDDTSSDDDDPHNLHEVPPLSICKKDTVEYYRLFKAVDLHSYDGFEHKKLRKSASSSRSKDSRSQKSVFVKVRLS